MNKFSYANDDILASFVAEAQKFPLITAEQERELTNQWRDEGDKAALTLLLGSHLRLVIKIAHGNRGYGLPLADLIAEGNVGLMQAVERFDPDRGFRFSTYAQWWVRAAMQEYIMRTWSMVRMGTTAAQKKLFFNLRRLKSSLNAYEEGDLSPEVTAKIAAELDVSEKEVVEMNRRLAGGESSLNIPVGEDGDTSYQDFLEDESPNQETTYADAEEFHKRWALVEKELAELTPRERHILTERKLSESPKTLGALGDVHGVSRERIRQIEANALKKLKKAVCTTAGPQGLLGESEQDISALMAAA
jgi:RNA polymerase sigma-32 factor